MQLDCPHCNQTLQFSGKRPAFCAYCGKSLPPASEDATAAFDTVVAPAPPPDGDPAEVGGYRLLRVLGEGGMGRVYEAEDAATGRRVALKLIAAEYAGSPAAVERFRREGRLASGVSHPRCVFVLAADESGGRPYIVMELMPGETLQDLVDREGPMPVEKALSRILDVIEGLREAHRLGVVHRDVKPSNCFLDAEGRVKIGDFGLSKSLAGSDALTRTGTFLGTPLFASPEQIKGGTVGPQSDLYSVAATLYCLLTGRAPFQGGDSAATLARIVSDPAPPMRSLRRDLPAALDQAVLRGLERDPARRWRDLDEFRAALLPFVPGRLSIGGLGIRFGAFLIDYVVLIVLCIPLMLLSVALKGGASLWEPHQNPEVQLLQLVGGLLVWLLYFGGCETAWGCTPGKRWLGLRVYRAKSAERPGVAAVALRTCVFYVLMALGGIVFQAVALSGVVDPADPRPEQQIRLGLLALVTFYPLEAVGIVSVLCTMRARNGYRGLHGFLSGTRVVRLPDVVRGVSLGRALELETTPAEGLPARVGPFEVLGQLAAAGLDRLLLGRDPSLGRRVWLWLRPADAPALSPARRELGRTTRPRWLAGGREEGPAAGHQWDAFLAPDGGPLAGAAGLLSWREARPLLGQLAEELTEAEADGTLPAPLSLGQVWIRPDGQAVLLDMAVGPEGESADAAPLTLLAGAALLALGAKPPKTTARPPAFGVPLPQHAAALLGRLFGRGKPVADVRALRAALAATTDMPAEVTRPRRIAHLAVLTMFLSCGLCGGLLPAACFSPMQAFFLGMQIRQNEVLLDRLHEASGRDAAAAKAAAPPQQAAARRDAEEDARLEAELVQALERSRQAHRARLDALDWIGRSVAGAMEKQTEDQAGPSESFLPPASDSMSLRNWAQMEISQSDLSRDEARRLAEVQTVMLLFWPAVWVLWAFVFRGGLSFPLTGLALVRRNGRPALRVQCAWRALLVWAPVTALAAGSVWLNAAYWIAWPGPDARPWMLWAASAGWWASLALLPLYAILAIWLPQQSLHDRLAGTYLVPR